MRKTAGGGGEGGAHYVSRSHFKKMFNVLLQSHLTFLVHLDILSLMKNSYTFDGFRRVYKQKTEMLLLEKLVGCQFRAPD